MVFACGGVWLYYRRQLQKTAGESPILKSETVAAYVDTFVTVGTGLALILMAIVPQDSPFAFLNYIGDSIIVIGISLFLLPPPIRVVSHSFFSLIGRTTQNQALRLRTETAVKAALDPSFKLVKVLLFHVGSSYEVDVSITPHNDTQMNLSKFRATRESLELELKKLYPNLVLQVFLI
jgi:divalent metal cation (Fe/Co/Zn/Cd) transporter